MIPKDKYHNYSANISFNNNLDQTYANTISVQGESDRSFFQPKKVYYLAASKENIQVLKDEQLKGLEDVLIGLKKEYDEIKMEIRKYKDDTQKLEKKIKMIKEIDDKNNKESIRTKIYHKNILKAIDEAKERLNNEDYKKKTMIATLSKIKKDITANKIKLKNSLEKQNLLKDNITKQKMASNEILSKENKIISQINMQKEKNYQNSKEFNLQLKYYTTIIRQKLEYIQAAEERKERQMKIQKKKKKKSNDKEEKDKRELLQLLYLTNNYLRKKMENEIEKNKQIEDTFKKVQLICGTNNLKKIIEKIIAHDKRYNYTLQRISEKENQKQKLKESIKQLDEKLSLFKNELVVATDSESKKELQIIKAKDVETSLSNEQLLNEEKSLIEKCKEYKDLNILLSLRYDQVVNSLRKLCSPLSISYLRDVSLNVSRLNNKSNITTNIIDQSVVNSNEVNIMEKKDMDNKEEEEKVPETDKEKKITNLKDNSYNNSFNYSNNFDNNSSLLPLSDEIALINGYKEYLKEAEKTIDVLFLIKSKSDFLQMIREKASEYDEANKTMRIMKKIKQKLSKNMDSKVRENIYNEYEYCSDELDNGLEKEIQEKIFNAYMNAEKRKMDKFINNEKEKKSIKGK